MKDQYLSSEESKIRSLIAEARKFNDQLELQSHWARYLCILVAGFLENSISKVYSSYAHRCSNPRVSNYAQHNLNKILNPKAEKFLATAKSFDKTWADELDRYMADNGRKDAIDSIISNRNNIAHGRSTNISLVYLEQYFKKCLEVISYIEQQCDA